MTSSGKKQKALRAKIDPTKSYSLDEVFGLVVESGTTKFDQSVDLAIRLGIDPKQSDQQVRGAVVLPNGLGKKVTVIVFAKGPKEAEAKEAGADFVGAEDLVEKIVGGWMDFDKVIATPDMMAVVSKVAKILGPRGLMPNPKLGTVTFEVKKAVQEAKAGKVEFRNEKAGVLQAPLGRVSFGAQKLKENFVTLIEAVQRLKPHTAKGIFFKTVSVSATMGPGVKVDSGEIARIVG